MKRFVAVCSMSLFVLGVGCSAVSSEHGEDEPEEVVALLGAELENGQPLSGLSGRRGSQMHYSLNVPEGATNLKIVISGGTGDADLYVRHGEQAPTTRTFDYRPYIDGNEETVTAEPVKAGNWQIMIRGYQSYSGLTLRASFDVPKSIPDPDPNPPNPDPDPNPDPEPPNPDPDPTPTGPNCQDPASWPAEWVQFEDEVLLLINERRAAGATCGGVSKPPVGPVAMNAALRVAARCHSMDMGVNSYFSHTGLDGRSPFQRMTDAGYSWSTAGENIAAGYGTPAVAVDGWMNSSGHCNNIMSGNFTETGLGYALVQGSPYGRYWTQTFGRP